MTASEWALLAILSSLWGGTFFFQAVALTSLPPLTLVLLRVAGGAAILLCVLRVAGLAVPWGVATWRALALMALLNNVVPFSLFAFAQTQIPSGLAAILNATTPIFGVLVAHALTDDEKLTPARLAGVLLGFAGVAAMVGPTLSGRLDGGLWGQLACLAAAVSYAFSGIQGRRLLATGLKPLQTAMGQLASSTVLMLPLAALVDRFWTLPNPPSAVWLSVAALAALSTALAYIIFFRILRTAGATNLLLVTFLIPVSAIGLGTLFLGEQLEGRHLLGMALIATGLAAIDGRLLGRLRERFG